MTPDARFTALLDDLKMLGVTQSNMFGKRGMMADGSVFARILDDAMSFKLADGSKEHAEALALEGAELWDGHGDGHPFKGWVSVPVSHGDEWGHFAELALRQLRHKL
jgi:hypothetical protein